MFVLLIGYVYGIGYTVIQLSGPVDIAYSKGHPRHVIAQRELAPYGILVTIHLPCNHFAYDSLILLQHRDLFPCKGRTYGMEVQFLTLYGKEIARPCPCCRIGHRKGHVTATHQSPDKIVMEHLLYTGQCATCIQRCIHFGSNRDGIVDEIEHEFRIRYTSIAHCHLFIIEAHHIATVIIGFLCNGWRPKVL